MLVLWPSGSLSPFHHSHATVRSIPQHPAYTSTQYEHIHSTPTRTRPSYNSTNTYAIHRYEHIHPTCMSHTDELTSAGHRSYTTRGPPSPYSRNTQVGVFKFCAGPGKSFRKFQKISSQLWITLFSSPKANVLRFGSHCSQVQEQIFSSSDHIPLEPRTRSFQNQISHLSSPQRNLLMIGSQISWVQNKTFSQLDDLALEFQRKSSWIWEGIFSELDHLSVELGRI